jgi:hypothetical protein
MLISIIKMAIDYCILCFRMSSRFTAIDGVNPCEVLKIMNLPLLLKKAMSCILAHQTSYSKCHYTCFKSFVIPALVVRFRFEESCHTFPQTTSYTANIT